MATASFVGLDTTTKGNWIGTYGVDGYQVPYSVAFSGGFLPSYCTAFSVQSGVNDACFSQHATDDRYLLRDTGEVNDRYQAFWYLAGPFDISFTLTSACRLSIYIIDHDAVRQEKISILDGSDTELVPPQTILDFYNGLWLLFDLSAGDFKIHTELISGYNAFINGVFFDPLIPTAPIGRLCGYGQGNGLQF